jgi:hypothetical protein
VRGPIRRAVAASKVKGLAGVTFASERARELALEAGLAWLNFENVEESAGGGYTADDVRRIIRELES